MKDTNYVEKYLTQKKFSALDIVLIIVCVAAVIWAIFLPNGIPVGIPVLFVAAVSLLFSQSRRVKDSHFDSILKQIMQDNNLLTEGNNVICVYDLRREMIKKGKDGVFRTDKYVITNASFERDGSVNLIVNRLDLVTGAVKVEKYCISKETKIALTEQNRKINSDLLEIALLESDMFEESIPVSANDYNAEKLISRLCG